MRAADLRACGDLQPDEAAADDRHAHARPQLRFKGMAVVECTEVVDARQVATRGVEPPHPAAGRQ